jgi:hypothetical protein
MVRFHSLTGCRPGETSFVPAMWIVRATFGLIARRRTKPSITAASVVFIGPQAQASRRPTRNASDCRRGAVRKNTAILRQPAGQSATRQVQIARRKSIHLRLATFRAQKLRAALFGRCAVDWLLAGSGTGQFVIGHERSDLQSLQDLMHCSTGASAYRDQRRRHSGYAVNQLSGSTVATLTK